MLINVSELEGQSRRLEYRFSSFDTQDEDIRCTEQPFVSFDLSRRLNEVRIAGRVVAAFETVCDRCLASVECKCDELVDLRYLPRSEAQTLEDERELGEQDLIYGSYDGGTIDLTDVVREQIFLFIPSKLLCREDCRGLCPACGINLNVRQCDCQLLDGDPRWSALRALQSSGEES